MPPPPPPGARDGRPAPKGEKIPAPKGGTEEVAVPTPAYIVVSLPAAATLSIDDAATVSASGTRVFTTPALQPGTDFSYTLKGELVREGRTISTSQIVKVRAGQETRVNLEFPAVSVAQK